MTLLQIPDVALILILFGILLVYAEFNRPGTIVFACAGTLSAVLGVYGLIQHPLSDTAVLVAAVGLTLILLELKFRSHNILALLGTLILGYSLTALIRTQIRIDTVTALASSTIFSVVTLWLGRIALQARRNKRIGRVD